MIQRFAFLVLVLSLVACQTKKEATAVSNFQLSGTVADAAGKTMNLSRGDFKEEIKIDTAGHFSVNLPNLAAGNYFLIYERNRLTLNLKPEGDLAFTTTAGQFKNDLKYSGSLAAPNNYLVAKDIAESKDRVDYKELLSADEAVFLAQLEERSKKSMDRLNGFADLSDDFKAFEAKSINYERLYMIGQYESGHQYYTKNEDFEASTELKKMLEGIEYDNETDFLNHQFFQYLVQGDFDSDDLMGSVEKLKTFKSDLIKSSVAGNLKYALSPTMDDLEGGYKALLSVSDSTLQKDLTEIYDVLKKLTKGSPSPGFNFVDRDGKEVQLEDLKGKNVYIDVWATWCGPCKAEIPSLKALEKKYHDKNIEFVSISVDKQKDAEKWKTMIEEKELKGIQLMADKDWKSDFVQGYGIKGIPRFILVDDKGLIVSADAARPSQEEEVKQLFEEVGI